VLPVKDRNTVLVVSNYAASILNNYYHEALPATSAENMFYEQIKHDISTSIKQKKPSTNNMTVTVTRRALKHG
jgi:hypothetical protein